MNPSYLVQLIETLATERAQALQRLADVGDRGQDEPVVRRVVLERGELDRVRIELVAQRFRLLVEADVQLQQVDPLDDAVLQRDPVLTDEVDLPLHVIALLLGKMFQAGRQPDEQVINSVAFDLEGE